LKENVHDYISGLDFVNSLHPVRYNYKEKTVAADGNKPHIGFIAQELQAVRPTAVGKHASGYLNIDIGELVFNELIYALINAVQELDKRTRK